MTKRLLKWLGIAVPRASVRVEVKNGSFLTPYVYEISWTGTLDVEALERVITDLRSSNAFVLVPRNVTVMQVWPV